MRRVVEFDLVTKSEANRRGMSDVAQIIHGKEVAAQRKIVGDRLRDAFGRTPPPLHVVQAGDRFVRVGEGLGLTLRNTFRITITRIAAGTLDDDNIGAALKHVRDEIAAWCGVPNDRDPVYKFTSPQPQRKAAQGVYRVEIEIEDLLTGEPRIVRWPETRSAGVQAAARVKRAIKKATPKPDRDPGEEQAAHNIAPCTTCGRLIGEPCLRTGDQDRLVFGVHVARARAAGLRVPDDDRAKVRPARAPRGPRKLVPIAQPSLPLQRAFVALPWEQPTCAVCQGTGANNFKGNTFTSNEMANDGGPPSCSTCSGIGRAKGRVLVPARRYDGPDEPPTTILVSVPAEHVSRYGGALTLHRHKFTSTTTGPCWLFDERTETT